MHALMADQRPGHMPDWMPPPDEREPPHSTECEQSLLGCLLLENSAAAVVGDIMAPELFYRHDNRVIYEAVDALLKAGQPADLITVFAALQARGLADEVDLSEWAERLLKREIRRRVHAAMVLASKAQRLGIAGNAIPADR